MAQLSHNHALPYRRGYFSISWTGFAGAATLSILFGLTGSGNLALAIKFYQCCIPVLKQGSWIWRGCDEGGFFFLHVSSISHISKGNRYILQLSFFKVEFVYTLLMLYQVREILQTLDHSPLTESQLLI